MGVSSWGWYVTPKKISTTNISTHLIMVFDYIKLFLFFAISPSMISFWIIFSIKESLSIVKSRIILKWIENEKMLHSKLNKIEKWCLYCFMVFCCSKVHEIKGPAVLASQIHRFVISLLQILLFYISALKERKNKKKRNKHGYWKNWYGRLVRQILDNV